jgi:hypothetical protein
MSNLTIIEKRKFEILFDMCSGYVLNFSNSTFHDFVVDSVGKNIFEDEYRINSGSKANCLRGFWKAESNHIVGKLLTDLIEYTIELGVKPENNELLLLCKNITKRLLQSQPVQEIDSINPNNNEIDFEVLAKSVRDAIDKNQPEMGLDRLHTFTIKYIRTLCEKHLLICSKDKPLHSIYGEYIKYLKEKNYIESEMTERILKICLSTLESFNHVRNNQSFAHDNKILNYCESLFIFNHVASLVRFLKSIEDRIDKAEKLSNKLQSFDDDLPF